MSTVVSDVSDFEQQTFTVDTREHGGQVRDHGRVGDTGPSMPQPGGDGALDSSATGKESSTNSAIGKGSGVGSDQECEAGNDTDPKPALGVSSPVPHWVSSKVAPEPRGEDSTNSKSQLGQVDSAVAIWSSQMVERYPCLFNHSMGQCVLWLWYHQDPVMDEADNSPKLPLEWDSCLGRYIAHPAFLNGMNLCIAGNCLFMSLEHEGQSNTITQLIVLAEVFFCFVFLIEAMMKLAGKKIYSILILLTSSTYSQQVISNKNARRDGGHPLVFPRRVQQL